MNVFRGSSHQESVVDVVSLKETVRDIESHTSRKHAHRPARTPRSNVVSIYSTMNEDPERDDISSSQQDGQTSIVSAFLRFQYWRNTTVIVCFVITFGILASSAIVAVGVTNGQSQQKQQFQNNAKDIIGNVEVQFLRYVSAASFVHSFCSTRDFDRTHFQQLYLYLIDGGLEFKAVQFNPYVQREQRIAYEDEARQYYADAHPQVDYRGFVGFENGINGGLLPRSEQPFYYPIHYMEPIPGNEAAIDLDYYSHISRRQSLTYSLDNGLPALTERLVLVKDDNSPNRCSAGGDASYGVVLFHPGVNTTSVADAPWPRDVSSIVVCIPSLLGVAFEGNNVHSALYLYDITDDGNINVDDPPFLGGVVADGRVEDIEFLPNTPIGSLKNERLYYREDVDIANRRWRVVVVPLNGEHRSQLVFVILGGIVTFLASIFLALWVIQSSKRVARFNEMKADAEAEKASLILENARQATRAERELNDFIGHEVRNPVSAAMTACSFVKTAVNKPNPLLDAESRESVKEDVDIIDSSLKFVNDLLRNMLDMHRAATKQLRVKMAPTDLLHDVLEPVGGMLHQRNSRFEVLIDCPENLFIRADSLRLKQIMLNLGRNSSKFISKGFIRLRAAEVNGIVQLSVDDSGSGIPAEKRGKLFSKFQESLDVLSQGTGIGLFLCKNLTEMMGGKIYLDDEYNSGVEGCPGTRFVIDMQVPPLDSPSETASSFMQHQRNVVMTTATGEIQRTSNTVVSGDGKTVSFARDAKGQELPEACSVLFVDDDAILRKLFCRSIKFVSPAWNVRQAASGEAALRLVETGEKFDLIFVDMYMASVEKQLLGTETVAELRLRGIDCRICGLSANDKEKEFLEAGADAFCFKPFPCEKSALEDELRRVMFSGMESVTESA